MAFTSLLGCPGSECPTGTVMAGERCVDSDAAMMDAG